MGACVGLKVFAFLLILPDLVVDAGVGAGVVAGVGARVVAGVGAGVVGGDGAEVGAGVTFFSCGRQEIARSGDAWCEVTRCGCGGHTILWCGCK